MIKSKITALFSKLRAESLSSKYFDICSMKRVENESRPEPRIFKTRAFHTANWSMSHSEVIIYGTTIQLFDRAWKSTRFLDKTCSGFTLVVPTS